MQFLLKTHRGFSRHATGFTLIELLVVISIIGLLSSIIFSSLSSARLKARDAARMQGLVQFRSAAELYTNDNGHYPYTCSVNYGFAGFTGSSYDTQPLCTAPGGSVTTSVLSTIMAPYIQNLVDPKPGSGGGYLYTNTWNANSYCFMSFVSPENMNDFAKSFWNSNRLTTVDGNGQCNTTSCSNAVYIGVGSGAGGC